MSRIERWRAALAALGLVFASTAVAAPTEVSLLLGDLDSMTAVEAARILRQDRKLADVRFNVYPASEIRSRDLAPLKRSRVVLLQTVGRTLAHAVAPELDHVRKQGGRVYAVGVSWDDDLVKLGLIRDESMRAYMAAGGPANVANMVRAALAKAGIRKLDVAPPAPIPEFGAFDPVTGTFAATFEEYRLRYGRHRPDRPWVGIPFYRSNAISGQTATLAALTRALEARHLNVLPFFGFPSETTLERFGFDRDGKPILAAVGALSLKISNNPKTLVPLLRRLDAPLVNLIVVNSRNRAQWEASPQGLDIMERAWQVSMAEYGGLVAPTVVATKEKFVDPVTGLEALRETPIPERVERAADRLARWVALRETPNAEKRVAIIYYNYPPGRENIGAAYLNVLPKSLWNMLGRLSADGYDTRGAPASADELFTAIRDRGGNIGNWKPGSLELLVRKGVAAGTVQLLPVSTYREWLERDIDASLRDWMIAKWGQPEDSNIMVWRDPSGKPYFVFPAQRYGNTLFAPQPTRGWEQDVSKLYHDVQLPPHHQYLAFYLWLQKHYGAHAMVHVGTHATHEWHAGKEVGFTAADASENFVGPVPQLYAFIVDDIGESLQAKRRGMATIISHMTPPLDRATLNPELKELAQLISDWSIAKEKSPGMAESVRAEIDQKARKMGLLTDVGLTAIGDEHDIEALDDHITEIAEKITPFGLHTFGSAPAEPMKRATVEAILSIDPEKSEAVRGERAATLAAAIEQSAVDELDAFARGLAGGYIAAGPGNDPVRNPDALPTGRNLYGFDPSRMPSRASWNMGEKLARELAQNFHDRKGQWPTRLVYNLWGVESNRHEGVMESQIMALMGVRPRWDERGKVAGVEVIPRAELGRPRCDVTIIPSGLYRDLFSQVMKLLDEAVTLAQAQPEEDNVLRANVAATRAELLAKGLPEARAAQLAAVRLFSVPSGAYGTNVANVVPLSNTYGNAAEADEKVSGVYFMRMHHAFGQGMWGESVSDAPGLAVDLFKSALKGAHAAIHSRSSNVFATLDNDDFYQYLGATAQAIRQVNGATPEVLVTNMANPKAPKNETLEKYMGREMRARYLNPKWIDAIMAEGYAGAKLVNQVVEHLYGWQVTVPEAVDGAKWQEMYETWVADRHHLNIRQKFRDAKNLLAYQTMIDRMLVAVKKGYWKAAPETVQGLEKANLDVIAEAGVGCYRDTCSSEEIVKLAEAQDRRDASAAADMPAPSVGAIATAVGRASRPVVAAAASPGAMAHEPPPPRPAAQPPAPPKPAEPPPAPGKTQQVEGLAMNKEKKSQSLSIPPGASWQLMAAAVLLLSVAFVYRMKRADA